MTLVPGDPLAHRALESLLRAEASVRRRLRTSKANATEVVGTLEARGLVARSRLAHDKRAATVTLTHAGREVVERLFPEHTARVEQAFAVLDEAEKRSLAELCRKLAA